MIFVSRKIKDCRRENSDGYRGKILVVRLVDGPSKLTATEGEQCAVLRFRHQTAQHKIAPPTLEADRDIYSAPQQWLRITVDCWPVSAGDKPRKTWYEGQGWLPGDESQGNNWWSVGVRLRGSPLIHAFAHWFILFSRRSCLFLVSLPSPALHIASFLASKAACTVDHLTSPTGSLEQGLSSALLLCCTLSSLPSHPYPF